MAATQEPQVQPTLVPTMGLGALVIFGIGDMLGSGIYALIGKAAGAMGNAIWLAFLTSMAAAVLTGLSYASLGSRYPRAAGAAYVTQRAFHWPFLSYLVGLAVAASGLTSFATQSRAFSGYLMGLLGQPAAGDERLIWPILAFIGLLTLVNLRGIKESTWLNLVCTTVEVSGLLIVIVAGLRYWGGVNYLETPPGVDGLGLSMVLSGGVLTFFSFIGFEDMINVVEEVKDPRRTFPRGVIFALAGATMLYLAVSISAVSAMPHALLAQSEEPLVDVVRHAAPGFPPVIFSFISLFAITNTALLNYIMGSRLLYGMAHQGLVPRWLGSVHPTRRTPHKAILTLMAIALGLALWQNVGNLAKATSVLLLSVFVVVNAALVILKRRPGEPPGAFEVPVLVPAGGIVICAALLLNRVLAAVSANERAPELTITALLLGGIAVLYAVVRPSNVTEETLAELADGIAEPGDAMP